MRKDLGRLISKEEFMSRINAFNSDINIKM